MENHNAYSSLATRNPDPLDHPDHAAASLATRAWSARHACCQSPISLCSLWYTARQRKSPRVVRGGFSLFRRLASTTTSGGRTNRSLLLLPDPWRSHTVVAAGLRVDPACR